MAKEEHIEKPIAQLWICWKYTVNEENFCSTSKNMNESKVGNTQWERKNISRNQ